VPAALLSGSTAEGIVRDISFRCIPSWWEKDRSLKDDGEKIKVLPAGSVYELTARLGSTSSHEKDDQARQEPYAPKR
jgi:hypothetical protein